MLSTSVMCAMKKGHAYLAIHNSSLPSKEKSRYIYFSRQLYALPQRKTRELIEGAITGGLKHIT